MVRSRGASLTDSQMSSVDGSGNQTRPASLANQKGSSVLSKMPAYKLKEQDASSLAEIAMSLASEVDEYLTSTDWTNRRTASMRDDERIGTPVKVKPKSPKSPRSPRSPKKSRTKSPTGPERLPLSVARQVCGVILLLEIVMYLKPSQSCQDVNAI